jgi:O-antigen ligase
MYVIANLKIDRSERVQPIIPIVFFVSPVVASLIPRLTWLLLPLIATALIVPVLRRGSEWRQLIQPNATLFALLAAVLYVFANATWAVDRGTALGKGALLLGVILIAFAASRAAIDWDKPELRRVALPFAAGVFLGALLVWFELLTDGALTRLAMNSIGLLELPKARRMHISQGQVTEISLSELNQNITILIFNLWPGLLALTTVQNGVRRAILSGLLFLAVAIPVLISEHQSSQVALIGSIFIFVLAWVWRRPVIRMLAVIWCLAFVLVLPLSIFAFKADLHMASWLPKSARARVILWEYTTERVLDHPWLGIGADSTRALASSQRETAEQPKGFVNKRTTGWHAHNFFLQTWYELGLVGVILIGLCGVAVALRILVLPPESQPFAAAAFTAFLGIAGFAWGMWQTWLMCAAALMLLYLGVVARALGGLPERLKGQNSSLSQG